MLRVIKSCLAGALALGGCHAPAEQARLEATDAEGRRVAAIAEAFAADDCAQTESLAAGFTSSSALRVSAVATWLGRCLYDEGRFADAERVLTPVAGTEARDRYARRALYTLGRAIYRQRRFAEADALFVDFQARFPWDSLRDDAAYQQGKARFRGGDLPAAEAVFQALLEAADASPFRRAGATYQLGRVAAAAALAVDGAPDPGRAAEAFAYFEAVGEQFADTGYVDDARYRVGRLQSDLGDFAAAERTLEDLEGRFPASGWREGARYHRARAVEEQRRFADAAALYADWPERFPDGGHRDNAAYRRARVFYRQGEAATTEQAAVHFTESAAAFEDYLRDWPGAFSEIGAHYFLGRALAEISRPRDALPHFATVIGDGGSLYVDNALYAQGYAHYVLAGADGNTALEAALSAFDALLARFPDSPEADAAAYFRARVLFRLMRSRDAEAAFAAFFTTYPESPYADNALFYSVLLTASRGACDDAQATLERLRGRFPESEYVADAERAVLACAPVTP